MATATLEKRGPNQWRVKIRRRGYPLQTRTFETKATADRAGIEGLRFHDLRHEATSRLFERGLNIMEVSTITGHKTLSMLKRYTHLRAEDLAERLG